jgi:hypothetical protein
MPMVRTLQPGRDGIGYRIPHSLFRRDLISQKRHIGHNESAARASCHSQRVVNHRTQSYGNGRVQAQNHVPKLVSHQQQVNAARSKSPAIVAS